MYKNLLVFSALISSLFISANVFACNHRFQQCPIDTCSFSADRTKINCGGVQYILKRDDRISTSLNEIRSQLENLMSAAELIDSEVEAIDTELIEKDLK